MEATDQDRLYEEKKGAVEDLPGADETPGGPGGSPVQRRRNSLDEEIERSAARLASVNNVKPGQNPQFSPFAGLSELVGSALRNVRLPGGGTGPQGAPVGGNAVYPNAQQPPADIGGVNGSAWPADILKTSDAEDDLRAYEEQEAIATEPVETEEEEKRRVEGQGPYDPVAHGAETAAEVEQGRPPGQRPYDPYIDGAETAEEGEQKRGEQYDPAVHGAETAEEERRRLENIELEILGDETGTALDEDERQQYFAELDMARRQYEDELEKATEPVATEEEEAAYRQNAYNEAMGEATGDRMARAAEEKKRTDDGITDLLRRIDQRQREAKARQAVRQQDLRQNPSNPPPPARPAASQSAPSAPAAASARPAFKFPERLRGPMTISEAARLLGLHGDFTEKQVSAAFRRMALLVHPDKLRLIGMPEAEGRARFIEANDAAKYLLKNRFNHRPETVQERAAREEAENGPGRGTKNKERYGYYDYPEHMKKRPKQSPPAPPNPPNMPPPPARPPPPPPPAAPQRRGTKHSRDVPGRVAPTESDKKQREGPTVGGSKRGRDDLSLPASGIILKRQRPRANSISGPPLQFNASFSAGSGGPQRARRTDVNYRPISTPSSVNAGGLPLKGAFVPNFSAEVKHYQSPSPQTGVGVLRGNIDPGTVGQGERVRPTPGAADFAEVVMGEPPPAPPGPPRPPRPPPRPPRPPPRPPRPPMPPLPPGPAPRRVAPRRARAAPSYPYHLPHPIPGSLPRPSIRPQVVHPTVYAASPEDAPYAYPSGIMHRGRRKALGLRGYVVV